MDREEHEVAEADDIASPHVAPIAPLDPGGQGLFTDLGCAHVLVMKHDGVRPP